MKSCKPKVLMSSIIRGDRYCLRKGYQHQLIYCPNQKNVPDPANLSKGDCPKIGTKLRMAQYLCALAEIDLMTLFSKRGSRKNLQSITYLFYPRAPKL